MALKYILYGSIICGLTMVGYFGFLYFGKTLKSSDAIVVEATFMQYACGDEVDDMQVQKVNNNKYTFLIGRDIDPQVIKESKDSEFKDYFYQHQSDQFGMTFRLRGRLNKFSLFGCSNSSRLFWVEEIEMLDGSNKMTSKDILESLKTNP